MNYLVFCTFDLKGASSQDYESAYSDLVRMGLGKIHANGSGGANVIPTTAVMGFFEGTNPAAVCEDIRDKIRASFVVRKFKSEIFIVVGGNWAWVAAST